MRKARVLATSALLLAVVLVAALAAAGCGSSASSGSSASTTAGGMTAAQIMAKSQQAMTKVSSASFTADVTVRVGTSGGSAQAMILGQKPIVLHLAGKADSKGGAPAAAVAMTVQAAGQNLALGVKAVHKKVWVQFGGKWYVAPKSTTSKAIGVPSPSSSASADPTKILSGLGIDPQKWMKASTVSTEQIDGAATYHVVATVDTARVMADVAKLLSSPGFAKAAGTSALGLPGSAELKNLEKSFTSGSAEWWVDASTFALRRGKVDETFKFGSGASTQGVTGFTVGMNYTLSGLNSP